LEGAQGKPASTPGIKRRGYAVFLEQDSTTVPNFVYRLILSCGNLVGVATPSPPFAACAALKNPRKKFFREFENFFQRHDNINMQGQIFACRHADKSPINQLPSRLID